MVFVDFWNFTLSLGRSFPVDWERLGPFLAQEASAIVDADALTSYQGMYVYGSYDPNSAKDKGTRKWLMNTVDKFRGAQVILTERQHKGSGPKCPACYKETSQCPSCSSDMRGTEEKGVDTRIATDMIKFAWIDNYDIAVLLSSDRDFVPVIDFLDTRGIKTIHAAFPPSGSLLTQRCWGNINVPAMIEKIRRS